MYNNHEKTIMLDGLILLEKIKAERELKREAEERLHKMEIAEKKRTAKHKLKRILNAFSFMGQVVILGAGLWVFCILWALL